MSKKAGRAISHVGATDAIREALKKGECDKKELARRTGLPVRTLLPIVSKLCLYGGAVALGTRRSRTYASAPEVKAEPSSPTRAGRRPPIEFTELKRDPFALMNLAMETRRG